MWRGVRTRRAGGSVREGIYVARLVRGSLDEMWRRTQEPGVRRRWDLSVPSTTR